jgi:hypothetical protein
MDKPPLDRGAYRGALGDAVGDQKDERDPLQHRAGRHDHAAVEWCRHGPAVGTDEYPGEFGAYTERGQFVALVRGDRVVDRRQAWGPGADRDHGDGHRRQQGEGAGDVALAADRRGRLRVVQDHRGVEDVGRAAAHPGHAAHQVEQVPPVGRRHRPGQLDDRARRELGERGREPAQRPRPGHAEDVAGRDEVHQGLARGLAQSVPQRLLVVVGEVEHEGVPEPERRAQFRRKTRVQGPAGQADLDAHHARVAGGVEQPGNPEPADAQPVGDVDLGHALQIELSCHPGSQDHLGRPIRRQADHVSPSLADQAAHLSARLSFSQLFVTLPSVTGQRANEVRHDTAPRDVHPGNRLTNQPHLAVRPHLDFNAISVSDGGQRTGEL